MRAPRHAFAIAAFAIASSQAGLFAQTSAFTLSVPADLALGSLSIGVNILPYAFPPAPMATPSADDLPSFDAACVLPYSKTQDDVSSCGAYAALLLPASALLFVRRDADTMLTYAAMYAEAFALTYGIKDAIKRAAPRARPYAYADSYPAELEEEAYESFPSGHTALAFMGASFLTAALVFEGAPREYTISFSAGAYAVAGSIGVMRVTGGTHFPTDVVAGAFIGSAVGWLVPALHLRRATDANTSDATLMIAGPSIGLVIPLW